MNIPHDLTSDELAYIKRSSYLERFAKLFMVLSGSTLKNKECKLFEVGCRTGMLKKFLNSNDLNNIKCYGIDIDTEYIKLANLKGFTAKFCDLNFDSIPFDDNTFDYTVSFEVIEHLPFYHNHFKEINRILKKNGRLLLTTPNIATIRNRINFLLGKDIHNIYSIGQKDVHYRMFTLKSINKLFLLHGFQIEESKYIISRIKSNNFSKFKHIVPSFRDIIYCCGLKK